MRNEVHTLPGAAAEPFFRIKRGRSHASSPTMIALNMTTARNCTHFAIETAFHTEFELMRPIGDSAAPTTGSHLALR